MSSIVTLCFVTGQGVSKVEDCELYAEQNTVTTLYNGAQIKWTTPTKTLIDPLINFDKKERTIAFEPSGLLLLVKRVQIVNINLTSLKNKNKQISCFTHTLQKV